jgi:hypothetical protein
VESSAEALRLGGVLVGITPVVAPLPLSVNTFVPAEKRNLAAVLPSRPDHRSDVELLQVVRALTQRDMDIALLARGPSDAKLHSMLGTHGLGERVTVVDAEKSGPLSKALSESRICVLVGDAEDHKGVTAAAMLCATPLALLDPNLSVLPAEWMRVALPIDGSTLGDRVESLERMVVDQNALRGQGEAARMYALATLSPESCAARMLGVYLRALGDAAA